MKVNKLPVSLPLQSISVPFNQQRAQGRENRAVIKAAALWMRADHQESPKEFTEHTHTHTTVEIEPQSGQ